MTEPDKEPQVGAVLAAINQAHEATLDPEPTGQDLARTQEAPPAVVQTFLPEGCPVTPLGKQGDLYYYLDAGRELQAIRDDKHGGLKVAGLFGDKKDVLYESWPRYNAAKEVTGWNARRCAEDLMAACSAINRKMGPWNPFGRVRGAGAWLGENGELVIHTGIALCIVGGEHDTSGRSSGERWMPPGVFGRSVYPTAPLSPRPTAEPQPAGEDGPAGELLKLIRSWNWRRGETDAMLLLGWIGAAMLAGALKWRPMIWITGRRYTGKTTLRQDLLEYIFDGDLLSVSDTSRAAIWQQLQYAALPVAIDELEADADNRRASGVIQLARQATSGGVIIRGSAEGHSVNYLARSCFLLSSILVPPLTGQDRSRMAILELDKLAKDQKPPPMAPRHLREIGAGLRRRLIDGWPRWPETLEAYRMTLIEAGHEGRGADQFGTLLAAADLLLYDQPASGDELSEWGERLNVRALAERSDDEDDEVRCLNHLLSSIIDPYRQGTRRTVAQWVAVAAGNTGDDDPATRTGTPEEAATVIGTYGLKIVVDDGGGAATHRYLAVANSSQGLAGLFTGTHWAGASGRTAVWIQALRRLPGVIVPNRAYWFAGVSARATLIPLEVVLGEDESLPLTD